MEEVDPLGTRTARSRLDPQSRPPNVDLDGETLREGRRFAARVIRISAHTHGRGPSISTEPKPCRIHELLERPPKARQMFPDASRRTDPGTLLRSPPTHFRSIPRPRLSHS